MRRIGLAVILTLSLSLAPLAAEAQQAGGVYRLGILSPAPPPASSDRAATEVLVLEALRELGYVEAQNLVIERRFAGGKLDRLPVLAQELVRLRPDIIFAIGVATRAAKDASRAIPIVILALAPVERGYVASLAQPGGNITGVVISETGLADKRLELLKEMVPGVSRVAVLDPGGEAFKNQLRQAAKAASLLGVTLLVVEVHDADFERAFAKIVSERADGLLVLSSSILHRDRKRIIALAAKHRLPALYEWREMATDGGLMAYGSNISALSKRVAIYIDRILKGASPATLPLEQPTLYELVINLKTAKALGLTIPQSILVRADEVIE
jgi:putative tryptophan/tyrosine transport system substrate-binding protein